MKKILLSMLLLGLSLIIGNTAQAHHAFLDDIAATWPVTGDFLVYDGYEYVVQADGDAGSLFQSDGDGTYTWVTDITIGILTGINGETIDNTTDGTWDFGDADLKTTGSLSTGDAEVDNATLSAIEVQLVASVDAVAVFRGSVANDDDPLWPKKTAWTSWYQETLNTATRGATREFPAEYLIVATASTVTIYDATDADLPMWMVFSQNNYSFIYRLDSASIKMLNSQLIIAAAGDIGGLSWINFVGDQNICSYWGIAGRYLINLPISGRNNIDSSYRELNNVSLGTLVNAKINAIALTRLPDAPINPATGMRYVTIDAFTDAGTSRITRDSSGDAVVYDLVDTAADDHVSGAINAANDSIAVNTTDPAIDVYEDVDADTNTVDRTYGAATTPALLSAPSATSNVCVDNGDTVYHGNADGLTAIFENTTTPASGAVAYVTTTHATPLMVGDVELCLDGSSITDRCVTGTTVTDNGTATFAAIDAGDLQATTADGGTLTAPVTTAGECYGWECVATVWTFREAIADWAGVSEAGGTLTIADGTIFTRLVYTNTTPSAAQLDEIERLDTPLFDSGALMLLSGSSNSVLALDYDSTTDTVEVLTDVRDTFSGLVNIDQNAITGTGQAVSASGGTVLVGTSSQVTFTKPALLLREELTKGAERVKQFGFVPQQFRFTGDASETDFDLPAGWGVWAVYSTAGALMLSTDDYTVENNGSNKTVVFAAAPAALDFIIFGLPE